MKQISHYEKEKYLKICTILFIILMIFLIITKFKKDTNVELIEEQKKSELFSLVNNSNFVDVSKYTIYGTHFNLEGTLDLIQLSGIKITNVDLIVKNLGGDEFILDSSFNFSDNTLSFSTTDKINKGLNLEQLNTENFYIFVKVAYSNGDIKYYTLKNSSEYANSTYYSITKNNLNNKIDITFEKYKDIPYLALKVSQVNSLPQDVYDIAIDPGHGGLDSGAVQSGYKESELVLTSALDLKNKLENLGLKVFISRNGSESNSEDTENNMYNENGRINILNKSHAKILISLHINENTYSKSSGGVEVYAPNDCDLSFAKLLAKNIVDYSGSYYSKLTAFKKDDGVYIHNFTNADILAFKNRATKNGYEPYNITTSTPYLYVIRETGGISTNAFVDGRNKNYGKNNYYNSNIGIESYVVELGYMKNQNDLENIVSNYGKYMDGIVEAIKSVFKI